MSLYTLERHGVSISRLEEKQWLGSEEPSIVGEDLPAHVWNADPQPADREAKP